MASVAQPKGVRTGLGERPRLSVLLVEDSRDYAQLVRDMVDGIDDIAIDRVARAGEAERRLRDDAIDCVLLDLTLPDAEGLEGLRQLSGAAPEVPLVVLSATHDDALAIAAVHEGAQDFLMKSTADGPLIARAVRYAVERKRSEALLAYQALHDGLTGLPNRKLFADRLGVALRRRERTPSSVAVLFLDLDNFKTINDSLGHDAGDMVLVDVAERLRSTVRPSDTVARFGGDEFVVLCDGIEDPRDVGTIVHRIGAALCAPLPLDGRELYVTPSIGIAWAAPGSEAPGDLLRQADAAMYRAKERPGFAFDVFEHDMHSSAVARLDTHGRLHRALRRGELVLHWQPQVDLDTGELVGLEALARWEDPDRGLVPPSDFVPVAESSGLINDLGVWVVHEACRQMAEWRFDERDAPPRISVNVSPRQLDDAAIVDAVRDATSAYDIEPALLTLELTETVLPGHEERAAATAHELCALGCVLSLDDFGTGYASLGVLTDLPLQQLKIDRTFVSGMLQHESRRRIVGAVAQLCRSLGFEAVAEGIEDVEELAYLRGIGCRVGQGFFISRPLPAADVGPWLDGSSPFAVAAASA